MGQIVVRHRQDRSPKPRSWRFRGAAVSAAGVRGAGLVVEPGPQSLDINAFPLTTTQEHKLNCGSSGAKAGS